MSAKISMIREIIPLRFRRNSSLDPLSCSTISKTGEHRSFLVGYFCSQNSSTHLKHLQKSNAECFSSEWKITSTVLVTQPLFYRSLNMMLLIIKITLNTKDISDYTDDINGEYEALNRVRYVHFVLPTEQLCCDTSF